MNIDFLDEFVFLADSLSFKRTADHFYVSRSVISRHMTALEETVGTRLLERDTRGVALTEAGSTFYRDAKTVLNDWKNAIERARGMKNESDPVRIGYLRNASRPILVQFVRHMAKAHSNVHLSSICMEYDELKKALEDRAIDIALAVDVNSLSSQKYRSTVVYRDRFYAVCSKDHPLARQSDGLTLKDLHGQKVLLPAIYADIGLSTLVSGLADENNMHAARSFYRDVDMLYLKVQTEGYIAFSSGMNNIMFGDRLAILPLIGVDTEFSVSAFYHDELTGSAYSSCREGFEWCRDELEDRGPGFTFK